MKKSPNRTLLGFLDLCHTSLGEIQGIENKHIKEKGSSPTRLVVPMPELEINGMKVIFVHGAKRIYAFKDVFDD